MGDFGLHEEESRGTFSHLEGNKRFMDKMGWKKEMLDRAEERGLKRGRSWAK